MRGVTTMAQKVHTGWERKKKRLHAKKALAASAKRVAKK
jgi:hypothetical protein